MGVAFPGYWSQHEAPLGDPATFLFYRIRFPNVFMGTWVLWDINRSYPKKGFGTKRGVEINKDATGFSLRTIPPPKGARLHCAASGGAPRIRGFPDSLGHETPAL